MRDRGRLLYGAPPRPEEDEMPDIRDGVRYGGAPKPYPEVPAVPPPRPDPAKVEDFVQKLNPPKAPTDLVGRLMQIRLDPTLDTEPELRADIDRWIGKLLAR